MAGKQGVSALGLEDVLERVAVVAREVAARDAAATDSTATWPEAGIRALQDAGLGGLTVDRERGGLGLGLHGLLRVCEILGEQCASTAICFGMHCVGAAVIAAKATPDQEDRYLSAIVAGEHLTTLALSEAASGAQFYIPHASARPEGTHFVVDGEKAFVTNGAHADSYVISVAATDAPVGEFSCLVLDGDTPGMRWGDPWSGFGMRGNDSRTLALDGVRVPAANLLGSEGDELWYVFNVVAPFFLTAMAGTYLGVAEAALQEARSYVARRTYSTTGHALAGNHLVQHRLGTMWAGVERTRRLVYATSLAADDGHPDALPGVLSSKAEVAECAVATVNEAMTLTGGAAYAQNAKLQRHLRDARASHVMAPTTDVLRMWTGRVLLDQPLLAE